MSEIMTADQQLSAEAIDGMVAFYRRMHARVECPYCHDTVALVDAFKCTDCERPYHRQCLGKHCQGEIERLAQENGRLRTAVRQAHQERDARTGLAPCSCIDCHPAGSSFTRGTEHGN